MSVNQVYVEVEDDGEDEDEVEEVEHVDESKN